MKYAIPFVLKTLLHHSRLSLFKSMPDQHDQVAEKVEIPFVVHSHLINFCVVARTHYRNLFACVRVVWHTSSSAWMFTLWKFQHSYFMCRKFPCYFKQLFYIFHIFLSRLQCKTHSHLLWIYVKVEKDFRFQIIFGQIILLIFLILLFHYLFIKIHTTQPQQIILYEILLFQTLSTKWHLLMPNWSSKHSHRIPHLCGPQFPNHTTCQYTSP